MILPKAVVEEYNKAHREYQDLDRKHMRCRLCPDLWKTQKKGLAEYWHKFKRSRFRGNETVYKVTFANGTVAYYHVECWNRLEDLCKSDMPRPDWLQYCQKLASIEMNSKLLLAKTNWLSAAYQHFLLGPLFIIQY